MHRSTELFKNAKCDIKHVYYEHIVYYMKKQDPSVMFNI